MESPKQRADWKAAALSGGALSRKTRGTHRMAMMTGRQNGRAMRSNARNSYAVFCLKKKYRIERGFLFVQITAFVGGHHLSNVFDEVLVLDSGRRETWRLIAVL